MECPGAPHGRAVGWVPTPPHEGTAMAGRASPGSADLGLSHVALVVRDVDASVGFYEKYAGMEIVHRRGRRGRRVVWLSDLSRPFAIVLLEADRIEGRLGGAAHLGIGCESRAQVDALCRRASLEGCLERGARDAGPPVGYSALLRDPDGHGLELAYGQRVELAIGAAQTGLTPCCDASSSPSESSSRY